MGKLTALQIKNAKGRGLLGDGGGLYLKIAPGGSKSWVFRYRINGKLRDHGLGSANTLSLSEARDAALECRKMRLNGLDPIEEKKKQRIAAQLEAAKSLTFADCAEAYIQAHRSGWKSAKHAAQWKATLSTYAHPAFGNLPVGEIDVGLVLKALEPIWTSKPETAGRVKGRIESVLDWARVRGYRTGENPARWRGNLSHLLPARNKIKKVVHHAALPHTEMGTFWTHLSKQSGTAAMALRFVILTAARTGEVLGATWDEIDIEQAMWVIPAERMKASAEHRIPLSWQAVALLAVLSKQRTDDYVFPGAKIGRPLSNMAMMAVLRRMEVQDATVHGFRSTFRDWAAESTEFPREVAEAALAHTLSNKVEAAYRRSDLFDKRRTLMTEWAMYCTAKSEVKNKLHK